VARGRFYLLNAPKSRNDNTNCIEINEMTEYFLPGSFASWLAALGVC
jgi:hypothetical protein